MENEFYDACRNGDIFKVEENFYSILYDGVMMYTGLTNACYYGHSQIVERLIEISNLNGGLNLYDLNRGLVFACQGGHLQIVERMIELGANRFNWGLVHACFGGRLQIVERLIELGADDFNSGLTNACIGGRLQIVERMIELGGKFNHNSDKITCEKLLKKRKILNKLFIFDLVYEIIFY